MKKTPLIFLIVSILFCTTTFSQDVWEWSKNYGGSNADTAADMIRTVDGGIIITGWTESTDGDVSGNSGLMDFWIVKLDIAGNLLWERTYGGAGLDISSAIKQTADNGFIVTGNSNTSNGNINNNGDRDSWVLKLDNLGNIEWGNNYGGLEQDLGVDIVEAHDGGYVLLSNSRSNDGDVTGNNGGRDYWIVKLDLDGNVVWDKNYGGSAWDSASSLKVVPGGGYLIGGWAGMADGDVSMSNGSNDIWLVKIDNDGNLEWEKNYGGTGNDVTYDMKQTLDGGYILVGRSTSTDVDLPGNNGAHDSWIIKLDADANLEWSKNYGGSADDAAWSVTQTTEGKYIVVGTSESNDGDVATNFGLQDSWIMQLDSEGDLEWQSNYGGTSNDLSRAVLQVADHEFLVASWSESTDGFISDNKGDRDIWLMKLNFLSTSTQNPNFDSKVTITPNPSSGEIIVRIEGIDLPLEVRIIDAIGHIIYNEKKVLGPLTIADLPKGNYYIEMSSEDFTITKKLFVL